MLTNRASCQADLPGAIGEYCTLISGGIDGRQPRYRGGVADSLAQ